MTCKIRQEERQLATTGPQLYLNAGTWINAFCLALMCRETARLPRHAGTGACVAAA
ncbi:Imm49 family immunity protein [Streptomyces sp. NPDC048270]|uniref:Imm49 family immunity protein n=1 Tax=Streptomyces sp. NPDC048270 TaxID=3154615 RepID=UPI0033EA64EA